MMLTGAVVLVGCAGQEARDDRGGQGVIWMDGYFEDWEGARTVERRYSPQDHDVLASAQLTNDQSHLYVRLDLREERNLQRDNDITLWLDGDADASTGLAVGGAGVDLTFTFGRREGYVHAEAEPVRIRHGAVGLHYMPTHSSTSFELSIPRSARPGDGPLFGGDSIRIAFTEHPDDPPAPADFITHHWFDIEAPPLERDLSRERAGDLRVLTYNVFNDGIFHRPEVFGRILRAIDPDVIALLEMYDHTAEQTIALLDDIAPLDGGGS